MYLSQQEDNIYISTDTIPVENEGTETSTDFFDNNSVLYNTLVHVQEEKSKFAQTLNPSPGNMPRSCDVSYANICKN